MDIRQIVFILSGVIVLAGLLSMALLLLRRAKNVRKIRNLTKQQKSSVLNELAAPFGFLYLPEQDIFSSRRDAWQRKMGYEGLFDRTAPAAGIVIDAQPVYFDHEGRTWMVEFWKGQYGINTGAEIGIYHAEGIVFPEDYKVTHFDAAEDHELPYIKCRLKKEGKILFEYGAEHWWLTGFVTGMFSGPAQLSLEICMIFNRSAMAEAFVEGLEKSTADCRYYKICGNSVCMEWVFCGRYPLAEKLRRCLAQFWNRFCVKAYCAVTSPFQDTADRVLFLYCQLPRCFRKILRRGSKTCCRFRRNCNGMP